MEQSPIKIIEKKRFIAGLIAAPVFAGCLTSVPMAIYLLAGEKSLVAEVGMYLIVWASVALVTIILGFAIEILIGLPLFYAIRKRHLNEKRHFVCIGLIVGLLTAALLHLRVALTSENYQWEWAIIGFLTYGAIAGASMGCVFWRIGIRTRS